MGKNTPESCKTLFDRKEQALIDVDCTDALGIASFDELQSSLHSMANDYGNHGFPDIVSRVSPGLRYLDSFHKAITSASQYDPRACLVWDVMQAFIKVYTPFHTRHYLLWGFDFCQSAIQSNVAMNDMLGLISELTESLPDFGAYLRMFPESPALQAHFQDIFETYMNYCISSIKYMKKRPSSKIP